MWKVHEFCDLPMLSTVEMSFFRTQIHIIVHFFAVYHGFCPLQRSSEASVVAETTAPLRPVRAT